MKMKKEVKVFTLPNEQMSLNDILNDPDIDVVDRVITPCPKEGIILYLVEIEKYIRSE